MQKTAAHLPPTRPAERATPRQWFAVLAVAAATFSIVTTEMLPVGLLTPIGEGLGVTEGAAGLTVTLTGLVAALAAPTVPPALGRLDRRLALTGLMLLLAAANVLSAMAPSFTVLLAARVLVGVTMGGIWALAANQAARLVPARSAGTAVASVYGGIGVASVLGVPAGTFLGGLADWRAAFGAAAGLALLVAAGLALLLPALPAEEAVRPRAMLRLLGNARLRTGLIFLVLVVTGHFAAYTYVRPVLEGLADVGPGAISAVLLAYGAAGIAGNFTAGATAARSPRGTLLVLSAGITAAIALLALAGSATPVAVALLLVWGLAYGGISVGGQNWIFAAEPRAREAATALYASVFNLAIALGAFAGGRVADAASLTAVLWLAAALAAAALLVLAAARR